MDEGIDRAGAAAMTGLELSGWRNRGSEAPDASETQRGRGEGSLAPSLLPSFLQMVVHVEQSPLPPTPLLSTSEQQAFTAAGRQAGIKLLTPL